jgi:hypothetical protein
MQWQIAVLNAEAKGANDDLALKIEEHETKVRLEQEKLAETKRTNVAKEKETTRHNQEAENIQSKTKTTV